MPPRILEKFTPKKVKRGSSITFSVKVEGEAAVLERLTATSCLSLGAGPVPGGVLSLAGLDSLPSVPQDTQPPLCIGSRRRQRRECCGLAPKPLATPWPALPSSIAWSCWTWAESTRAPTRALLPTLPARRSALPACTSLAVSEGRVRGKAGTYEWEGTQSWAVQAHGLLSTCGCSAFVFLILLWYQDTSRARPASRVQGRLVWGFRVSQV